RRRCGGACWLGFLRARVRHQHAAYRHLTVSRRGVPSLAGDNVSLCYWNRAHSHDRRIGRFAGPLRDTSCTNLLGTERVMEGPQLYATFAHCFSSFQRLPEAGDAEKSKLIFFSTTLTSASTARRSCSWRGSCR